MQHSGDFGAPRRRDPELAGSEMRRHIERLGAALQLKTQA